MLELSFDRHHSKPPFPDIPPSELEIWYENNGGAGAFGCIQDGRHWMLLPEVASFCFDTTSREVKAFPYPLVGEDQVRDTFLRCVLPIAVQVQGLEVLHASAVRHPRGAVAFCAVSGTGKSTIAYGLSRRGYQLQADDALAFEATEHQRPRVIPLPFRMNLRPSSASFFRMDGSAEAEEEMWAESMPLGAIFVLKRESGSCHDGLINCLRLSPNEAFAAILPHAYCFGLKEIERKRRMLQQYLRAAMHVPTFELHFPEGLERLPYVLDTIEQAIQPRSHDETDDRNDGRME
ncbi:MAG: hypothetical protein CVU64_00740 [Deltaproteobacteria bacterium HGW-Deltaproteobacteria-21]|nr:MAG: hypothetical protein CVU64_00740 [Deltaproteobacteria bacterium HGW-Deltaproteobacteria-21]